MFSGYGINSQLEEVQFAIESTSEAGNTSDSLQSDSDAHEDENSNHISQLMCIMEKISTSFTIKHPSLLKFHAYAVWQPPKNC